MTMPLSLHQDMPKKLGPLGFARCLLSILAGKPRVPQSLADNPLLNTILKRRSVRSFADREIPDDAFLAILEAGRLAPSTVNLQTWTFALFTPDSWRETFGNPIPFKGRRAVIVMGDTHRGRLIADVFPTVPLVEYTIAVMNASLAAMSMTIAAEALGVSSVMLSETGQSGFLAAGHLKEELGLPDGVFPLMTVVFGYARGPYPPMPPRLPLDQICFQGSYQEPDREIMADWLAQMTAGYKASHPFSSFEAQLHAYRSKVGKAEVDLRKMVFHESQTGGLGG